MPKLYDIAKDYHDFLESDLPAGDLKDCLDSIKESFDDKANNILAIVSSLDGDTDAIDKQIKRLQERKKAMVANKERLKNYLRENMELSGITKITHPFFSVTLKKPLKKVSVFDIDLLPDEFLTVKTEIKPDLNKLKAALKEGGVQGAELVDGKSSLLIK